MGNDAFTLGDCHDNNSSIFSKSGLMWFKMTDSIILTFIRFDINTAVHSIMFSCVSILSERNCNNETFTQTCMPE
jgi:hypothetical protein